MNNRTFTIRYRGSYDSLDKPYRYLNIVAESVEQALISFRRERPNAERVKIVSFAGQRLENS